MKNDILTMHRQGVSIKAITKSLGISRNTVRSYIREYEKINKLLSDSNDKNEIIELQDKLVGRPTKKSNYKQSVFTGKLKVRFYELIKLSELKDNDLGINKQKLTASLLHRKLRSEGFDVGITTIQIEFKKYKNKKIEAFIKQDYKPGFRAEYDFHEVKVIIDGKKCIKHQATITLPYSNYIFVKYYDNQKFESFIDSLISFFKDIGGVPATLVFDNMRNVVRKFVYRGEKEYTEDLIKLSNYYGFKIVTTNPRSGNEKGHVEVSGKIVRTELFTFNYKFYSLENFNEYVIKELIKLNELKLEKFNDEKFFLSNLPTHSYELGRLEYARVNSESLISLDTNFYSVPDSYVGNKVVLRVYIDKLMIYNEKNKLLATHNKKSGKNEYSINIHHFISTLNKKPGALENSLALKQAPNIYQELFHKYFTTNVKAFLDLINKNDIYELTIILKDLENGQSINELTTSKPKRSIEQISTNQINQISKLFNQGELKQ